MHLSIDNTVQMYIMDYMEQSTLHIKLPKHLHMAAKVNAARAGKPMNQYLVDLLVGDTPSSRLDDQDLQPTKNPHDTVKADGPLKVSPPTLSSDRLAQGLCKIHQIPLDTRGRCLQKGCKYA